MLLWALLFPAPAQVEVVAPPRGELQVVVYFHGTELEVLDSETPGRLRLLAPGEARLVELRAEGIPPLLLEREYRLHTRQVIAGGVVRVEEVRQYADRQQAVWRALPAGVRQVRIRSLPGGEVKVARGVRVLPFR